MTETEWTAKICHYMRDNLACVIKSEYAASRYQQAGWPDRYLVHTLGAWWLEFKAERTPVRLNQKLCMRELWLRQPGCCYIVRRGVPNRIEHFDSGACLAVWNVPEELLLALNEITCKTREASAQQLELMRALASEAVLTRLRVKR